ncbi:MAG: DnaD domain protein [Anaerolineaceae bacterium]|nr:DnaD domain protein [Anaerolineaceae bacterium]
MPTFAGFPAGKVRLVRVPGPLFTDLLPTIDHLEELKVTLYALWFLDHQEGERRYITGADFLEDERFMAGLHHDPAHRQDVLDDALERTVRRNTLLCPTAGRPLAERIYLLNSPRGRDAYQAILQGAWDPHQQPQVPASLSAERPNIYRLYEENIGTLTPLIADALRQAEEDYPPNWIEDAIRIAVERNARNWRYVDRVLQTWKEEGHDAVDRRTPEKDRRRYIEGEFAEFIES